MIFKALEVQDKTPIEVLKEADFIMRDAGDEIKIVWFNAKVMAKLRSTLNTEGSVCEIEAEIGQGHMYDMWGCSFWVSRNCPYMEIVGKNGSVLTYTKKKVFQLPPREDLTNKLNEIKSLVRNAKKIEVHSDCTKSGTKVFADGKQLALVQEVNISIDSLRIAFPKNLEFEFERMERDWVEIKLR